MDIDFLQNRRARKEENRRKPQRRPVFFQTGRISMSDVKIRNKKSEHVRRDEVK